MSVTREFTVLQMKLTDHTGNPVLNNAQQMDAHQLDTSGEDISTVDFLSQHPLELGVSLILQFSSIYIDIVIRN